MLRVLYIEISRVPVRESYIRPRPGWTRRQISLTYVLYAPRGEKLVPAPDSEIAYYPTYSASKLTFPLDAYRLASKLHQERPFDLVVANDPMMLGLVAISSSAAFACLSWSKSTRNIPGTCGGCWSALTTHSITC